MLPADSRRNKIRVSIIVGYYNRRPVLERTIRSLLSQTLVDYELIVFDDASTDSTAEELHRLYEEFADDRFRYIVHEENSGFTVGLVNAISSARGEYIAIHGSGDTAMPRRLELQAQLLDQRPDVGAVGCWYDNVNDSTGVRTTSRRSADSVDFDHLMTTNVFTHGEVMFRRAAYDEAGGYRPTFRFAQDIDLWIRIRQLYKFATVPEVLYERHILSDGVTHNPSKFSEQAKFSILARRLVGMGESELASTLIKVRDEGPSSVVPQSDPMLQKRYVRGTIAMALTGSPENAVISARENIANPWMRQCLVLTFRIYGSPLGGLLKSIERLARLMRATLRGR